MTDRILDDDPDTVTFYGGHTPLWLRIVTSPIVGEPPPFSEWAMAGNFTLPEADPEPDATVETP